MTARVAEVMRELIGATTITDGEMNAIIAIWLEVATEDAFTFPPLPGDPGVNRNRITRRT